VNPTAKERLGYATQKPVTLLDWIIQASSKSGETVLDPLLRVRRLPTNSGGVGSELILPFML